MNDAIIEKSEQYVKIALILRLPRTILNAVRDGLAETYIATMLRIWQPDMSIDGAFNLAEGLKEKFGNSNQSSIYEWYRERYG